MAGPNGRWMIEPIRGEDTILTAEIKLAKVREERHKFDPAGHYSRPDVTRLIINRTKQSTIQFEDEDNS